MIDLRSGDGSRCPKVRDHKKMSISGSRQNAGGMKKLRNCGNRDTGVTTGQKGSTEEKKGAKGRQKKKGTVVKRGC